MNSILISTLSTLATGLISWGLSIVRRKVNNDEIKNAIQEIDNIIQIIVKDLNQNMVKDLKIKNNSGLSKAQKDNIKTIALQNVKKIASESLKKTASRAISNLDMYIDKKIEEVVYSEKKS